MTTHSEDSAESAVLRASSCFPTAQPLPWSRLGSFIVGLLASVICLGCAREIGDRGDTLCGDCLVSLERLPGECCGRCAQPRPCHPCPGADAPWDAAAAACAHAGTARSLVSSLKRSGSARVARAMAVEIVAVLPDWDLESRAIVPVAPHPVRRRRSGVDHGRVLAVSVARLTGRPLLEPLARIGRATRQAGSSRSQRTEPGRIEFTLCGPVPERVLLIDDVHTTGATLAAATEALLGGGCRSVRCATFARALADPVPCPERPDW